jgi:hypothetical protein
MAVVGQRRGRGERVLQGFSLGLLFLLRSNQIRQGERGFEDFLDTREDPSSSLFPLLVGLAKEIGERERETWQG